MSRALRGMLPITWTDYEQLGRTGSGGKLADGRAVHYTITPVVITDRMPDGSGPSWSH